QCEKDCPDRGAGEPGKKQEAPRARLNFWNLMPTRDKNRQEHDQNKYVLPENNYLCVEKLIEWNTPRAFRAPERRTEADEPWTISWAAYRTALHSESV